MSALRTLLDDGVMSLKYKGPTLLEMGRPNIRLLYDQLVAWRSQADLDVLVFEKQGNTTDYEFTVTHKDGRVWSQEIGCNSYDPPMSYTVLDRWRESEFIGGLRSVRQALVEAVLTLGVEEVRVTFR